jgi:hypothetical protein
MNTRNSGGIITQKGEGLRLGKPDSDLPILVKLSREQSAVSQRCSFRNARPGTRVDRTDITIDTTNSSTS